MTKKNYFLRLRRLTNSDKATEGKLELFDYYNQKLKCVFSCSTLEPSVPSLDGGQYILKFTYSPKFTCKVPYNKINNGNVPIISSLLNGPSIENRGIRFHCGNTSFDTNGCVLVGRSLGPNTYKLADSRITYLALMSYLKDAHNEILLIINDETLPF